MIVVCYKNEYNNKNKIVLIKFKNIKNYKSKINNNKIICNKKMHY